MSAHQAGSDILEELVQAASEAKTKKEAAAVLCAVGHTPGLSESGIAPDVLEALLPDDGVVRLPRVRRVAGGAGYRFLKRVFDIVSCGTALIILAIPMAFIALKVRSESPGPAIYAQRRVGRDGCEFMLYKFRSMRIDAEAGGVCWTAGNDLRVTRFGKCMRRTRLDETPQFWNVVRGDMSLIGPRPALSNEVVRYDARAIRCLTVKSGCGGAWQAGTRSDSTFGEMVDFDLDYIERSSVAYDLALVARTARKMLVGGRGLLSAIPGQPSWGASHGG